MLLVMRVLSIVPLNFKVRLEIEKDGTGERHRHNKRVLSAVPLGYFFPWFASVHNNECSADTHTSNGYLWDANRCRFCSVPRLIPHPDLTLADRADYCPL